MRASADVGGLWQSLDTKMVGGKLVARMDDDRPDGTQEFRAVAKDVAGNQAVGDRRADGTKMELRLPLRLGTRVGTSASARSVKKCVRGKKKPRSKKRRKKCNLGKDLAKGGLTVEVGETRTVYGLLETVEGRLIDKGVVTVFERVRPGGLRSIDTLRADDSGRFAYKLRGGPSRTMRFVYAGSNLVKPSVSEVEVLTPALSSIRTNKTHVLNGQSVKFSGKLLGNPVPKGGKILELQALVRGRWRTFATPRADSKGEWTYAYKFQATTGTVRYKFRAWVRREDAYPYEDGVSRKVNVTVTGS